MTLRLIADIGGTNARFALVREGKPIGQALHLPAAQYPQFDDVLEAALSLLPGTEGVQEAAIAAAGPVAKGRIDVTNLPWVVEATAVSARLGGAAVRLLNDMEAVALALPLLTLEDVSAVRGAIPAAPEGPLIAINVGTGFGAATAVRAGGDWIAVAGEPGHMRFAAVTEAESLQLAHLHSVEDLLSGRGLSALYGRLCGAGATPPEAVFARVANDAAASAAADLFASSLGRIAGDLVLASGSWGGAFLCGSLVAPSRGPRFERAFLNAFDDKGAMATRMSAVPVLRITAADPAFRGLAHMTFRPGA